MREDWEQVQPNLPVGHLDLMLAAFPDATIWRWLLNCQDELIFHEEVAQFRKIGAFKGKKTLLNLSWGPNAPFVSRKVEFKEYQVTEVGISLDYLFNGSAKAQALIRDLKKRLKGQKFDIIRVHLIAQMLRHHGVLLTGLKNFLNELGIIVVADAFDKLNDRHPSLPSMEQMYKELERAQKATGGTRSAALRIQKRASVFGFRLLLAENIAARTYDEKTKLAQFRCFCFHVEILSKLFGSKYNRRKLLDEAKNWYAAAGSWGQMGLKVVIIQAVKPRALKRSRK